MRNPIIRLNVNKQEMARPHVNQFAGVVEGVTVNYAEVPDQALALVKGPSIESVLAMLVDRDGVNINGDQISRLLSLKRNGNPAFNGINAYTIMLIAEIGDIIRELSFETAFARIQENMDKGIEDITWINPRIEADIEEARRLEELETIVRARDDIGECLDCGSQIVLSRITQQRSGDEAPDVINTCTKCGSRRVREFTKEEVQAIIRRKIKDETTILNTIKNGIPAEEIETIINSGNDVIASI